MPHPASAITTGTQVPPSPHRSQMLSARRRSQEAQRCQDKTRFTEFQNTKTVHKNPTPTPTTGQEENKEKILNLLIQGASPALTI
jgi:hypothetical protein